ncbi:hypothetical protein Cgig2_030541 [Carnegiea gigantea]|uniref:Amine oxidase domain-containing protein n=1 Tax=Carnegiea gigantea TaxID=171969 RepID=A0A9Q1JJ65_9CARY|nr:hypothetical protein Cgig2_030541 [Carnegiea gigantea]
MPVNDRPSSSLLNDTLLEFDRYVSQPNLTLTLIPIQFKPKTLLQEWTSPVFISTFDFSCSNNGSSSNLLTLTIPRKRRRGRPRSTNSSVPSYHQVFSIPQIHGSSIDSSSVSSDFSTHYGNPSAQSNMDLSEEIIGFIPELPQRKLDAIKRLGFGLLNKVAMLFPHVFWGTDLDRFGHLSEDPVRRGEFFLFYSYATVAGGPLLLALVAGEAAHMFETMPPTDAVMRVLEILRESLNLKELPCQNLSKKARTLMWHFVPLEMTMIYWQRVWETEECFTGEATTTRYPATMHEAFLSGLQEAANVAHYATVLALDVKIERSASKNAHTYASLLADLFREPDLEFGSFSITFEKDNADPKSAAILSVTFTETQKKGDEGSKESKPDARHSKTLLFQQLQSHFNEQQQIHMYALLSKQEALDLREVRGGDNNRLYHLTEKLGVKLVGRKGLGPTADAAIASIKAERGNCKASTPSVAVKLGMLRPKGSPVKRKMIRSVEDFIVGNANALLSSMDANVDAQTKVNPGLPSLNMSNGKAIWDASEHKAGCGSSEYP